MQYNPTFHFAEAAKSLVSMSTLPPSPSTLLQQPEGVLKDLTQNANARVPGDLSPVL